jgi:hypothetical protein
MDTNPGEAGELVRLGHLQGIGRRETAFEAADALVGNDQGCGAQ